MGFYKIKKLILKYSSGVNVLVVFIVTMAVYTVKLLVLVPKVQQFANGMCLPDNMPEGYDFEYIITLFKVLGEQGRSIYLNMYSLIDMLYPTLFGICYCLLLAYFIKIIKKEHSILFLFCYVPFIAALANYFENIGMIFMLKQFPNITVQTVDTISRVTMVKNMATAITFATLLFLIAVIAIQKIRWKR